MDNTGEHRPTRTLSPLLRFLLRLKFWVADHLRLSERQVTLIWAALIGVLGALASESFRKASEILHYLATGSELGIISSFARLPWWQRLAVPTAGGLLAGLTLWLGNSLFASARQKTSTDYMEAIVVGSGIIPLRASLVKSLSALFSISTGTSIGREGPLVQISSLVASLVGRFRRFPIPQRRQLVACGAAAGLASAYNAPIAGAFFVAEIVLGTVVVESLGPLILASVTATFLSRAFHGESPLSQSPALALHTQWEIVPLCAIGIFMGLLAPLYLRVLRRTERLFSKLALPVPAKLALGRGRGRVAGNVLSSGVWQWERTDDLSLPSELGFLHGSVSGDRQAYSYLGVLRIRCGRRCVYADTVYWICRWRA